MAIYKTVQNPDNLDSNEGYQFKYIYLHINSFSSTWPTFSEQLYFEN